MHDLLVLQLVNVQKVNVENKLFTDQNMRSLDTLLQNFLKNPEMYYLIIELMKFQKSTD